MFCVFSGDGVNLLRKYLNEEGAHSYDGEITMFDEGDLIGTGDDADPDGLMGLMQSTVLDNDDGDGDDFDMDGHL